MRSPDEFKNNHFIEMRSGSEAGSYLRLIDPGTTQRKAQGPSRTCTESKKEEEEVRVAVQPLQGSESRPQSSGFAIQGSACPV